MQHVFLTLVWDRYHAGETQEWVQRHVHWGLRHRGDLFLFPPLGQQNQEENNPSAAAVDVPQEAAMTPSEYHQEAATAQPEGPPSAYCLPDWEDMDLDPAEDPTSVHSSPAPADHQGNACAYRIMSGMIRSITFPPVAVVYVRSMWARAFAR